MKQQGVIILRCEDFREFFHFPDFWNLRFTFAKYWKEEIHRTMFSDDKKVLQMLDVIINWIEGKDLVHYRIEEKCLKTNNNTNFIIWNYDLRIDKLLDHTMQVGVAALMIIIGDNQHAINSIFNYLFSVEEISDIDWSKSINMVHADEYHTIERYNKDEDNVDIRNILIVNNSTDGNPALIEIRGVNSVSIEPGGFLRLLMVGNKAINFLSNQTDLQIDMDSYTSKTPEGQPAVSFAKCERGGNGYITDTGKVKSTFYEIDIRNFSFLKDEQAVHIGVKSNGREGFVLTSRRRLIIFDKKSLIQGPTIHSGVVFAQYDQTDTLSINY